MGWVMFIKILLIGWETVHLRAGEREGQCLFRERHSQYRSDSTKVMEIGNHESKVSRVQEIYDFRAFQNSRKLRFRGYTLRLVEKMCYVQVLQV